jgi:hypothetical protein
MRIVVEGIAYKSNSRVSQMESIGYTVSSNVRRESWRDEAVTYLG